MSPTDARQLLADLREETARLRDPAELQFVGGDPAADQQAVAALADQRAGVPALRLQAPALATAADRPVADVLAEISAYAGALDAAITQLRSGRAPVTTRHTQPAPRDAEPATSTGAGLGAPDLAPPSWRRGAIVALAVLALVALVFVLLL